MNVLHDKVKKAVHKYINNMTVADLEQMKNDNGGKAKDAVAYLVKGKLTYEQKQILDDDEIDRTIQTYVDENYDELKRLIEQIKKCFPSDATVVEEKRGEVTMLDLRVGDRILTTTPGGKLVYEDVFMFGHADPLAEAEYISLRTENNRCLILSGGHLLHVGNHGNLMAAQDVTVGDVVFVSTSKCLHKDRVTEITTVVKKGIFCPHTTGGSIIVNGVLVSCYTDIINHQVAHVMLLPARMLYHVLPVSVFDWLFPYDQTEGMPRLLLSMKNLYQYFW